MIHGSKAVTTSGTEVRLLPTTTETLGRYCAKLTVLANAANTAKIYIGASDAVSTTVHGVALEADAEHTFGPFEKNAIDIANIWMDADVNGEGVKFFGEQI